MKYFWKKIYQPTFNIKSKINYLNSYTKKHQSRNILNEIVSIQNRFRVQ